MAGTKAELERIKRERMTNVINEPQKRLSPRRKGFIKLNQQGDKFEIFKSTKFGR